MASGQLAIGNMPELQERSQLSQALLMESPFDNPFAGIEDLPTGAGTLARLVEIEMARFRAQVPDYYLHWRLC